MSAFKRGTKWVAKFVRDGEQVWVPGGPWDTKTQALTAEQRHRDFLSARRNDETCASFADRWLLECPSGSLHANPRQAATPSPVARVEHLTAPRSFRSDPAEIGSGPVAAGSVAPPEIGSRPTPPERSTR